MRYWYSAANTDPASVVSQMRRLDNGSINDEFTEGQYSYIEYNNTLTLHDVVVFDGCHEAKIGRTATAAQDTGPLLNVSLSVKGERRAKLVRLSWTQLAATPTVSLIVSYLLNSLRASSMKGSSSVLACSHPTVGIVCVGS